MLLSLSRCVLLLIGALAALPAWAAVGRVLIAVGDVAAVRNGARVVLIDRAEVEAGDLLQVGAGSHLQLLMIDGAVLALRANSEVSIDAYRQTPVATENTSVLSLVKGGLRTVTGAIAQFNRSGYAVKTATSTIGVRGTHFTLVQCAGACVGGSGAAAPDGLYGGVSDGRVGVSNEAGEREFARNQYFYVADRKTAAVQIPSPPPFLRDPLDARAKAKEKKSEEPTPVAAEAVTGGDAGASSSGAATTAVADPTATVSTAAATAPPTLSTAPPVNQPVIKGVAFNTGDLFVRPDGNATTFDARQTEGFGTVPGVEINGVIIPGYEYRLGAFTWTTETTETLPDGTTQSYRTILNKSAATEVGTDTANGTVVWGRYILTQDSVFLTGPSTGQTFTSQNLVRHFVAGDAPTALPSSGSFTYSWTSGTAPTNRSDAKGQLISGGSIGVDFQLQTMSALSPIRFSGPSGVSYSLAFSGVSWKPTVSPRVDDPVTGEWFVDSRYPVIDVTSSSQCSGCQQLLGARVAPNFFGRGAEILGLGIGTTATTATGVRETLGSIQVYKR